MNCAPTDIAPPTTDYRLAHLGTGDWEAWGPDLARLTPVIDDWRTQLAGIEKPWLCWHVHDRLCRLQQRLVLEFGWTPVVGADPQASGPTVLPGAVAFDANRLLRLPTLWMWFVVEFAHEFAPRLAFWHSDFLAHRRQMNALVDAFDRLADGETAVHAPHNPIRRARTFPGVVGCTTRAASADQFTHGCGWWRWYSKHPNFRGWFRVRGDNWDHGFGLRYWQKHHHGVVRPLRIDESGHFNVAWTQWKGKMTKAQSIDRFFDLTAEISRLGLTDLDDLR